MAPGTHRPHAIGAGLLAALLLMLCGQEPLFAQAGSVPPEAAPFLAVGAATAAPENETLTFINRPIVVFRATVVGRSPAERVTSAVRVLDELVDEGVVGPVDAQRFELGTVVTVGSRAVFVLTPPDTESLAGQTLEQLTVATVARLREALSEASEARSPRLLLWGLALALVALVVAGLALLGVSRGQRWIIKRLEPAATRTLAKTGILVDTIRQSSLLDIERRVFGYGSAALSLVIIYVATTFILRRFPYTRPWGESMRGFLFATAEQLGLSIVAGLPGLFTVLVIFVIVRFIGRLLKIWFDAIEQGRTTLPGIYPDTARTTRRLVTTLLWLFSIVVAYPYMPGSGTDAFKGVSVFLGLMVTFGSSGLINQIVSGVMITYSRSLRVGDFVRVGDVEGTVSKLGVLSTKIETVWREVVTVPNAVVITQTATDYSRTGTAHAVYTLITVTIGYDVPWRQVEAMLLMAAERTPGLRTEPVPLVYKTELNDFYVKYVLLVCLQHPHERPDVLNRLHAHILDLFNEFGVQIMSPSYRGDPSAPKIVPKKDWYAEPARRDDASGNSRPPTPGSRGLSG